MLPSLHIRRMHCCRWRATRQIDGERSPQRLASADRHEENLKSPRANSEPERKEDTRSARTQPCIGNRGIVLLVETKDRGVQTVRRRRVVLPLRQVEPAASRKPLLLTYIWVKACHRA